MTLKSFWGSAIFIRLDESGSVAPIFGVSIIAILAIVGATLALSMDSRAANDLQYTADSAALGGAVAFLNSDKPRAKDRMKEARRQAKRLARNNSEIRLSDIDISDLTEDEYGQHLRLEIELEFKPTNAAAGMIGRNANVEVRRRAVAGATWEFPLCILTLATKGGGIMMEGSPTLHAPDCISWNNSRGGKAVRLDGGQATFRTMCAVGRGQYKKGDTFVGEFYRNCDALPDPMAGLELPEPGSCVRPADGKAELSIYPPKRYTRNKKNHPACLADRSSKACKELKSAFVGRQQRAELSRVKLRTMADMMELGKQDNLDSWFYENDPVHETVTRTLQPGTYCGLDIAYGHVKMEPGTYFIKDAPMTLRRRARLTAEGVTLIFTGPYAHLRVSDEASMNLVAPKSGPLAGFAVAETGDTKPAGSSANMNTRLTGKGALYIVGLIYLPTHDLFFSGAGTGEQSSPLLQIVASRLAMADNAKLKIDFDPAAAGIPVAIQPKREARLIE